MSLEVFFTPLSKETLNSVYFSINEKYGKRSADNFLKKAEKIIALISEHPYMFKATLIDDTVRVALVAKQTSLFYQVSENSINLLFFWDNRQEPFLTK